MLAGPPAARLAPASQLQNQAFESAAQQGGVSRTQCTSPAATQEVASAAVNGKVGLANSVSLPTVTSERLPTEDASIEPPVSAADARVLVRTARLRMRDDKCQIQLEELEVWVRACERLKDTDLLLQILRYMTEEHGVPSPGRPMKDCVFNSMMGAFCKGGQPEVATSFFNFMYGLEQPPNTAAVCWLIAALVKLGDDHADVAARWFHWLRGSGVTPNITAYNALITTSCKKELGLPLALGYLRSMIEDGVAPSVITYNALIDCVARGLHQHNDTVACACELISCMESEGIDASSIATIAMHKLGSKNVSDGALLRALRRPHHKMLQQQKGALEQEQPHNELQPQSHLW
eukprot:CAMPEP_0178412612 /NCGR_PEP_ID=MMETSP0689_2-20121128/22104_1 /TAXON_ID=160604 /ORGANISM="Amphidinium massartii, Strain CS-259" /LENGTH=348 /DNA_ID=CAMNT_0020033863 /DNA_START=48 /DNA_END=1092 /DNA_ORIENTATION=-